MKKILVEVCCGSADDVIEAKKAGADRVELNSDLFHGGLTPTVGSLLVAKRETGMKIMTMIRPREGGFCYTEAEFAVAIEDAKQLLANGSDGLVFGFLHTDGTIDVERTAILAKLAHSAGKEAVFHRAIDVVPDWKQALDLLIDLNITRVLTSGQEADEVYAVTAKEIQKHLPAFAAHPCMDCFCACSCCRDGLIQPLSAAVDVVGIGLKCFTRLHKVLHGIHMVNIH